MDRASLLLLVFLTSLTGMIVSCRHTSDIPAEPAVSFKNEVQVILVGNCTQEGCHGHNDAKRFSLITYDEVMASGIVTSGDGHASGMIQSVTGRSVMMPPSPKPLSLTGKFFCSTFGLSRVQIITDSL